MIFYMLQSKKKQFHVLFKASRILYISWIVAIVSLFHISPKFQDLSVVYMC